MSLDEKRPLNLTLFLRPEAFVLAAKIYLYKEDPLYRGVGRVQGQESCAIYRRDAQRTAYWRKEGYSVERRYMDHEVSAEVQVEHAH